ncbi:MAG: hypothetical protein EOO60_12230 [Hymenobacter sp.]|nr:MAG: hypothetical protein EOO60_12230 [Hymenobacter sp.]
MKQQNVSFKVMPDERREKGDNRFPLKLRVTYKGKRKYYGTGFNATNPEWMAISNLNAKGTLKKIQQDIISIEKAASDCAKSISPFSFARFENEFFAKKIVFENVEAAYSEYISNLKENEPVMRKWIS